MTKKKPPKELSATVAPGARKFETIPVDEPLPVLLSEWIEKLRDLRAKHGDVVFGADAGDLGEVPRVEFYLQTTDRRCERCYRILNRKGNNCVICGHWTDPGYHFKDRPHPYA